MARTYNVDSPELYLDEEILELIRENGIERAVFLIDIDKVPDKHLRTLLGQFESICEKIYSKVSPNKVSINGG